MQFSWAAVAGGPDQDIVSSVAADANGNIYFAGEFKDSADFDPGPASAIFTSVASSDACLIKLDPAGNYIWGAQFGNTSSGNVKGIACDGAGNVYATGIFRGTIDLDPGPGVTSFTTVMYDDIYIVSLDPQGNYRWGKQIGSEGGDFAWSICSDAAGNVSVLGDFADTMDFDPGAGIAQHVSAGLRDLFIIHLDNQGNYLWSVSTGGAQDESPKIVRADVSGNIYAVGYFRTTADFDPGPANFSLNANGSEDAFILKLDASGNFVWAKSIGGPDGDDAKAIDVDANGNVFVCGYFRNTVDFDPNAGVWNESATFRDGYLLKLDASGTFQWVNTFGNGDNVNCYDLAVSPAGQPYVTVLYDGSIDLDPVGNFLVQEPGTGNTAVAKYDTNGAFLWGGQVGGSGFDYSNGLVAANTYAVVGINFENTADLNIDVNGVSNYTSYGDTDMSVIKVVDAVTGVDEASAADFSVFPNPFKGILTIHAPSQAEITLYDASGRMIYSGLPGTINTGSFEAGLYILKVRTGDTDYHRRLIKMD
jgi:hypothetical protein